DWFTYVISDGHGGTSTATVTVTITAVDDPPVAGGDEYAASEDTTLTIAAPGVLTNDTDVDGRPITAALVQAPAHGTIQLNANDGTVDSNAGTITIHLLSGDNRAPEAEDQWVFLDEDTPSDVLLSAGDPEGDPLTYRIVTPPMYGTLSGQAPNLVYTPGTDFN